MLPSPIADPLAASTKPILEFQAPRFACVSLIGLSAEGREGRIMAGRTHPGQTGSRGAGAEAEAFAGAGVGAAGAEGTCVRAGDGGTFWGEGDIRDERRRHAQ